MYVLEKSSFLWVTLGVAIRYYYIVILSCPVWSRCCYITCYPVVTPVADIPPPVWPQDDHLLPGVHEPLSPRGQQRAEDDAGIREHTASLVRHPETDKHVTLANTLASWIRNIFKRTLFFNLVQTIWIILNTKCLFREFLYAKMCLCERLSLLASLFFYFSFSWMCVYVRVSASICVRVRACVRAYIHICKELMVF